MSPGGSAGAYWGHRQGRGRRPTGGWDGSRVGALGWTDRSGRWAVRSGVELQSFLKRNLPRAAAPPPAAAKIRYQLMNTVPEEWIPFIPVHLDGDNRETQLQRAAHTLARRPCVGLAWRPQANRPRRRLERPGL